MIDWFEAHVQPYWLRHIVIATAIMVVCGMVFGAVIGAAIAAGFYALREIYQRYTLGYWDHKGWIAPLLWCALMATAWELFA